MQSTSDILTLIGNTPIIEVTGSDAGVCRLFAKLENQNPGGSIKDRVALNMIQAAEAQGLLKPGGLIVEATAGNTGLSLALVAARKGYKLKLVVPDKMSREKISHLRALGAEIVLTRSDVGKGHPDYYQDLAARIAQVEKGYYVNQFGNPNNPLAHEQNTGPEIWKQFAGQLDAVICGVGSSGTITGLSRYFARVAPSLEMVLADPAGSILAHYIKTGEVLQESGSWLVEGIGEDFIPPIADLSFVRHSYTITDKESMLSARELLRLTGIFGGSSTGTLYAAAKRYCKEQREAKNVLFFVCDSGNKYLSKMYNDHWMYEQGMLARPSSHNLIDLILRRFDEGSTVTITPEDTVATALARMKMYDISQLPVLDGEHVIGIIDEADLLVSVRATSVDKVVNIRELLTTDFSKVAPDASLETLMNSLTRGYTAVVDADGKFWGLITRIDLLSYLRRKK